MGDKLGKTCRIYFVLQSTQVMVVESFLPTALYFPLCEIVVSDRYVGHIS